MEELDEVESYTGRVAGNYKILDELGRGGMGTVYHAEQLSLHRAVAVKILHPHLAEDEDFVKRFLLEGRVVASLNHRKILTVLDVGELDSTYFIAMELLKGRSVAQVLEDEGPFDVMRALDVVRQTAEALAATHKKQVIHRDIKPPNIMLTENHKVKVTDFGLAKDMSSESSFTVLGTVLGTPAYMSPEQCIGDPVDIRTDIYSLGVVLFEMLTDALPYSAKSTTALIKKVIDDPFPPLRDYNSNIPDEVAEILGKMTGKLPSERYPTAAHLVMDIRKYMRKQVAVRSPVRTPPARPTRFDDVDDAIEALEDIDASPEARAHAAQSLGDMLVRAGEVLHSHARETENLVREAVEKSLARADEELHGGTSGIETRGFSLDELVWSVEKRGRRTITPTDTGYEILVNLGKDREQTVYVYPFERVDGLRFVRVHSYCGPASKKAHLWALRNNMKLTSCALAIEEKDGEPVMVVTNALLEDSVTPGGLKTIVKEIAFYGDWVEQRIASRDEF